MCELYVRTEDLRSALMIERINQSKYCFRGTVRRACQLISCKIDSSSYSLLRQAPLAPVSNDQTQRSAMSLSAPW